MTRRLALAGLVLAGLVLSGLVQVADAQVFVRALCSQIPAPQPGTICSETSTFSIKQWNGTTFATPIAFPAVVLPNAANTFRITLAAPTALSETYTFAFPTSISGSSNGDCLARGALVGSVLSTSFIACGGGGGGNITSIGGQSGPVISAGANDTNVTLTWAANTVTPGWAGTLATARGGLGGNFSASTGLIFDTAGVMSATLTPSITSLTASSFVQGPIVDRGGQVYNIRANYGGAATGVLETNTAAANTTAFNALVALVPAGATLYVPRQTYPFQGALNFTNRSGLKLECEGGTPQTSGTTLQFITPSGHGLDLAGADSMVIDGCTITAIGGGTPKAGIFLSRTTVAAGGKHRFKDVSIYGNWQAGVYSSNVEENTWDKPSISLFGIPFVINALNEWGYTSTYATVSTAIISNSTHTLNDARLFRSSDAVMTVNGTSYRGALVLADSVDTRIFGGIVAAGGVSGYGLYFSGTSVSNTTITGLRWEEAGAAAIYTNDVSTSGLTVIGGSVSSTAVTKTFLKSASAAGGVNALSIYGTGVPGFTGFVGNKMVDVGISDGMYITTLGLATVSVATRASGYLGGVENESQVTLPADSQVYIQIRSTGQTFRGGPWLFKAPAATTAYLGLQVAAAQNAILGQAGANGALATAAITGDAVLRSNQNLILTSGGAPTGVYLATGGKIGLHNAAPLFGVHAVNDDIVADSYATVRQFVTRFARGAVGAPTAVQSGDTLGGYLAMGYSGAAFSGARASLGMFAGENWTGTNQGSFLTLATTPLGSTTLTEALRVTAAGRVGIGTIAPAFRLHTAGDTAVDGYGTVSQFAGRFARGTASAPTAALSGDALTGFLGFGYHSGGAFTSTARTSLGMFAAEDFTSTNQGTFATVGVTPLGSTTLTEAMRWSGITGGAGFRVQVAAENTGPSWDNSRPFSIIGLTSGTRLNSGGGFVEGNTVAGLYVQNSDTSGCAGCNQLGDRTSVTSMVRTIENVGFSGTAYGAAHVYEMKGVGTERGALFTGMFMNATASGTGYGNNSFLGVTAGATLNLGIIDLSEMNCAIGDCSTKAFGKAIQNINSAYGTTSIAAAGLIIIPTVGTGAGVGFAGGGGGSLAGTGGGGEAWLEAIRLGNYDGSDKRFALGNDGTIQTAASILPLVDNFGNVGQVGLRFANVYATSVRADAFLTAGGVAGADCPAGVTAATVVVVKGIVTHC